MKAFIICLCVVLIIIGFTWFVKLRKKTNTPRAIKIMLSISNPNIDVAAPIFKQKFRQWMKLIIVGAMLAISGCASQSAEEKQYEQLRCEWAGNNGKDWKIVGSDATGKLCSLVSTSYVGKDSIYAKMSLMLSNSVKTQTLVVVSNADCSEADSVLFFCAHRKNHEYIYLKKNADYHVDYVDAQESGDESIQDLLRPFSRGTVFVISGITNKVAEATEVNICVPLRTDKIDFAFVFEPKNKLK